ncbi:MAG: hypothetical protein J1E95_00690 [Muribaculaceae bacterium]|nr:hypothetical protein [Muribaculaceae bacterium]
MTAKDILSLGKTIEECHPVATVESDMPVLEIIPRLLDTPMRELGVTEDGNPLGIIDQTSLLEGIGSMIASRDDCSVITVECQPEDYSASVLAHAVEDSDAHLVDLLSSPGEEGRIKVTLRVRHSDPSAAIRSLERYDFHVIEAHASGSDILESQIAAERLLSLQALMNV